MNILVTGGAGFIGSHLVDALIVHRHRVTILDDLRTGKRSFVNRSARFIKGDVCDQGMTRRVFTREKPEVVFHLAAHIDLRKSVADPVYDAQENILGSLTVLEQCRRVGTKKFIFSSTGGAIYGDTRRIPTPEQQTPKPRSPYGINKRAIEQYLDYYREVHGIPSVTLRYSNVYGPRQNPDGEAGVVAIFAKKIFNRQSITINGDGRQTRDYVFVEDVVRANILAMDRDISGVFNIGTGKEVTVNALLRQMERCVHGTTRFTHGPAKLGEQRRSALNSARASRVLGWKPQVHLEEGLKKTLSWFQSNA